MNLIRLSNFQQVISEQFSIEIPNFLFEPNIYFISGENGSGKSFLLRYLAKLIPAPLSTLENTCKTILYLSNEDITFADLTIEENLALNRYIFNIKSPIDSSLIHKEHLSLLCRNASLGTRQKVGLSLALTKDFWDLIVLDEAISNLDIDSRNKLIAALEIRAAEGTIVLLVDHQIKAEDYHFKRIIVKEGRIYEEG